jgi:putative transcriptional regulator
LTYPHYVDIIGNVESTHNVDKRGEENLRNMIMVKLRGRKSQREMAKELDMPASTYSMIESGHRFPRKELQSKLASHFKMTVDELFFTKIDHESWTNTA